MQHKAVALFLQKYGTGNLATPERVPSYVLTEESVENAVSFWLRVL